MKSAAPGWPAIGPDRNEGWDVLPEMNLRCFFGFHSPALNAISRRPEGYVSICESCARPLQRAASGRWIASPPLDGSGSS